MSDGAHIRLMGGCALAGGFEAAGLRVRRSTPPAPASADTMQMVRGRLLAMGPRAFCRMVMNQVFGAGTFNNTMDGLPVAASYEGVGAGLLLSGEEKAEVARRCGWGNANPLRNNSVWESQLRETAGFPDGFRVLLVADTGPATVNAGNLRRERLLLLLRTAEGVVLRAVWFSVPGGTFKDVPVDGLRTAINVIGAPGR